MLSKLWEEARQYGLIDLFTADNGTYSCSITFNSIKHTELRSRSGHNHKTHEQAVQAAINNAQKIVGEINEITNKLLIESK